MSHMQPHPTHPSRAPRAHRDAVPTYAARHAARRAWHAQMIEPASPAPETVGAQTVFYVARGVAALLAAVAVGLSAVPSESGQPSPPYPSSSQATTR